MRSYEAARGLYSFCGFFCWLGVIVGGLGTLVAIGLLHESPRGITTTGALLAIGPAVSLAMAGIYGLALVQIGRAGVDSAEYAQQSLKVARDQLQISQDMLAQGQQMAASYAGLARGGNTSSDPKTVGNPPASFGDRPAEPEAPDAALSGPQTVMVAGRALQIKDGVYVHNTKMFRTIAQAEEYFSQLGVNPKASLPVTQ